VRSRVDGQLISVAFKEGQFATKRSSRADRRAPLPGPTRTGPGAACQGQAQRRDAEVNLERQASFQGRRYCPAAARHAGALVGQFDGSDRVGSGTD